MKILNVFGAICIAFFFFSFQAPQECECGDYESGRTFYNVGAEQECCSGEAGEIATFVTYEPSEGGTYRVVKKEMISGASAQDGCCSNQSS